MPGWASVVYFAATGRPPFGEGSVAAVLYRVVAQEPDLADTRISARLRPLLSAEATQRGEHRDRDESVRNSTVVFQVSPGTRKGCDDVDIRKIGGKNRGDSGPRNPTVKAGSSYRQPDKSVG